MAAKKVTSSHKKSVVKRSATRAKSAIKHRKTAIKASPLAHIRTAYGITEYHLSNGLRVLYKQDRTLPIAAACITYHVGSRNEAAGHTGATHILEHLMFKDSKNFSKQTGKPIFEYLEWLGAVLNATTWLDRTNYFEMLPRERVEEAVAIEADRMRHSLFNDADLASEMTVVRNEYEHGRNNPYELLDEEVTATAFTVHPYRIPTIGTREDIETATATKLREFYDRFYWPNNATLAIFGDVSPSELERMVVKHFGSIPSSPHPIPVMKTVEPLQKSARACEVKKQAGVNIAQLAYKIPHAIDPDFPAVYMLTMILAGGFSSRLQKALVDRGLASEISVFTPATIDPNIASFIATATDAATPEELLKTMRTLIAKVVKAGVEPAEVSRARERILSELSHERDGIFTEIRTVSEAVAAGDWTFAYRFEDDIKKIKSADIAQAAKKYFTPTSETSGILRDTAELPTQSSAPQDATPPQRSFESDSYGDDLIEMI